jgi:hypothetical protein
VGTLSLGSDATMEFRPKKGKQHALLANPPVKESLAGRVYLRLTLRHGDVLGEYAFFLSSPAPLEDLVDRFELFDAVMSGAKIQELYEVRTKLDRKNTCGFEAHNQFLFFNSTLSYQMGSESVSVPTILAFQHLGLKHSLFLQRRQHATSLPREIPRSIQ